MKNRLMIAGAVLVVLNAAGICAAETSVEEIVKKANEAAYYAGDDGAAEVKMTISDAQGRTRVREFSILRKDAAGGGEQKFYVYFRKPEDVRGMVYMVWKHIGRDDDRWLYLPALDLVKRIAAADKRSSFVGSDFVYEDVSGRDIADDTHELIETTDKYYKLKNVPKDENNVEFSYYYIWIDRETSLPAKAEYYDKEGGLYRIVESLDVKTIQGYPTVVKSKVSNIESGGSTVAEFKDVRYDIGITDDIFTERFLRRPPREWIR